MGTAIVAIVVGLLSGALGSVLGPLATHLLRRREREEEREREIHRELREMIEETLEDCGREAAMAFRIWAHMRVGHPPLEAYNAATAWQSEEVKARPRRRWEPYRITDQELRQLVEQLNERVGDLRSHHSSVMIMNPDQWWAEVVEMDSTLRELQRQVRLRLDELRW
jgi:hypothetical protein